MMGLICLAYLQRTKTGHMIASLPHTYIAKNQLVNIPYVTLCLSINPCYFDCVSRGFLLEVHGLLGTIDSVGIFHGGHWNVPMRPHA